MTPIPPVEVRKIRSCEICNRVILHKGTVAACKVGKYPPMHEGNCIEHITFYEIHALIDQHNAGERNLTSLVKSIQNMQNWAMPNPEYARGFGDALDQVLKLLQQPRQEGGPWRI